MNPAKLSILFVVRIIDDWVSNRRLALLVEAKVGKGKIMISGVDLMNDVENRLEAQQLKASLLNYLNSDMFNPTVELSAKQIKSSIK